MKIVIGDIHGCFDELIDLLSKIGAGKDDEIISIGDMVDRGPASSEVVKFFMNIQWARAIMGNHERKHCRHYFGLMPSRNFGRAQQWAQKQFKALGIDYEEVINYFAKLPLYIDLPEAILVHAGLVRGILLEKQNEKVLTGVISRPEHKLIKGVPRWCEWYSTQAKPVIFGHLSLRGIPRPYKGNLWHIDTGCCRGGFLTAVTLPDWKIWQVKSRKDYYGELKKQR